MSIIRENAKFSVTPADDDDARPLWAEIIASLPPAYRRPAIDYLVNAAREAREARAEAERLRPPLNRTGRLAERDETIRAALAALYPDDAPSAAAGALAADWARYVLTGWTREQLLDALPASASDFRRWMHQLTRLNGGRALGPRQILNVRDGFRTP